MLDKSAFPSPNKSTEKPSGSVFHSSVIPAARTEAGISTVKPGRFSVGVQA